MARPRRSKIRFHSPRLHFEALEDRRLLAVMTVTDLDDGPSTGNSDGFLNLREAIHAIFTGAAVDGIGPTSGSFGSNDRVIFNTGLTGDLNLSSTQGELFIQKDVIIDGPGANSLVIHGAGSGHRVFHIQYSSSLFDVEIEGLTITGGDTDGDGGGILTGGNLTLRNSIITGNDAYFGMGGGIAATNADSHLTVIDSVIKENYSAAAGGIFAISSELSITGSQIVQNSAVARGGGIGVFAGSPPDTNVFIERSQVNENWLVEEAPDTNQDGVGGGGIHVESTGTLELRFSEISGNASGSFGGPWNSSSEYGAGSGRGGGIYSSAAQGTFISYSLIYDNSCKGEGGGAHIRYSAGSEIRNTTISRNRAAMGGGLIISDAQILLSTITLNDAGGQLDYPGGDMPYFPSPGGGGILIRPSEIYTIQGWEIAVFGAAIENSIVADNTSELGSVDGGDAIILEYASNGASPDIGFGWGMGSIPSLNNRDNFDEPLSVSYSLIGNTAGPIAGIGGTPPVSVALSGPGNILNPISARLGPLQANGGFLLPDATHIRTHALHPLSPAVDKGSAGSGSTPEFDQRDDPFKRVFDWPGNGTELPIRIDMGAYELQFLDPANSDADFNDNGTVDGFDFLIWQQYFGTEFGATIATGDADFDGDVDAQDLFIWRQQFGANPNISADANSDSHVNASDYLVWQEHRGMTVTPGEDGDFDGNGFVDEKDFLAWQIEYSIETGLLEWMVHTLDFLQLADLDDDQILVSTLEDTNDGDYSLGDLSLREALAIANSTTGVDDIVFANHLAGTISLDDQQLTIASSVNIIGPGADRLTIDAHGDSRAIYVNSGLTITIEGLAIIGGQTPTGQDGGAIYNNGSDVALVRVVVSDNHARYGGAIVNYGDTAELYITDSTFADNTAEHGGAVFTNAANMVSIVGSTFAGNEATDSAGVAGVLYLGGATGGNTAIVNSTFSDNAAGGGAGAIAVAASSASLTVLNSTIAFNQVNSGGSGGGIRQYSGAATVHNSIVAKNMVGTSNNDVAGSLATSSSYSIFGAGAGSTTPTGSGNNIGSSGSPVDPLLEDLADNGGPTFTHKLQPTSPALDNGSYLLAVNNGLTADQRGFRRTSYNPSGGPAVDMGAYEYGLIVTTETDENDTGFNRSDMSLREALAVAVAIGGTVAHEIQFAPTVWGDIISLNYGHLFIDQNIRILGPGREANGDWRVTINAQNASRAFYVDSGNTVTIGGVAIINGQASSSDGGGIYNNGSVLTVDGVLLDGNDAIYGGAIVNYGDTAVLKIFDSTLSENTAQHGGALLSNAANDVEIKGSTFVANQATATTSGGGTGGAIHLGGLVGGDTTIYNSTFSDNSAVGGGGAIAVAASGAVLTVVNGTIAFNQVNSGGSGGGIRQYGGTATLHNTIVAQNEVGTADNDISGALAAASSFNIFGAGAGSTTPTGLGNQIGTALSPIDALLDALDDNGGPTFTRALLTGSPAIDRGNNQEARLFTLDQRRWLRFQDGDADGSIGVDIGAYELAADEFFSALVV